MIVAANHDSIHMHMQLQVCMCVLFMYHANGVVRTAVGITDRCLHGSIYQVISLSVYICIYSYIHVSCMQ